MATKKKTVSNPTKYKSYLKKPKVTASVTAWENYSKKYVTYNRAVDVHNKKVDAGKKKKASLIKKLKNK